MRNSSACLKYPFPEGVTNGADWYPKVTIGFAADIESVTSILAGAIHCKISSFIFLKLCINIVMLNRRSF